MTTIEDKFNELQNQFDEFKKIIHNDNDFTKLIQDNKNLIEKIEQLKEENKKISKENETNFWRYHNLKNDYQIKCNECDTFKEESIIWKKKYDELFNCKSSNKKIEHEAYKYRKINALMNGDKAGYYLAHITDSSDMPV